MSKPILPSQHAEFVRNVVEACCPYCFGAGTIQSWDAHTDSVSIKLCQQCGGTGKMPVKNT